MRTFSKLAADAATPTITDKVVEEYKLATPLAEPIFEPLAPINMTKLGLTDGAPVVNPELDVDIGGLALDLDPQAAGPLAAAKIVKNVMEGAVKFMKFVANIIDKPDTPEFTVAELVTMNNQILQDIQGDLDAMKGQLDGILDEIEGLSGQINTNLISEVTVDAFNLLDLIGGTDNPTTAELNMMVADGSNLMNLALAAAQNVSQEAPAAFIAGQIAPALMLATAARIASVSYASDQGLGAAAVQGDISAAISLLNDIFSPEGALGQQIAEEIEVETYVVYGYNGSHVFEFLVVETITGPGGTVVHNVASHHGEDVGDYIGDNFPAHYTRYGSINGVSVADGWQNAAAEVGGLQVDYSVPFSGDNVQELDAAHAWAQGARAEAIEIIVEGDISAFASENIGDFLDEMPPTFGLNEGDAGGNGADLIEGSDGSGEIAFVAPDLIYGGGGNDTLYGHGDADALFGEAGNDWLYGGDDNDRLFGGHNNDRLYGDDGHDKLQGDHGRDTIEGGDGDDILFQSSRGDFFSFQDPDNFNQTASHGGYLDGGKGNDLMVGDQGGDHIDGGVGHDTAYGYGGADEINGGAGNDLIFAGAGDDEIIGSSGDDTIEGGAGDDVIDGGFGDDEITGGGGDDTIEGGYGVDTVVFYGAQEDFTWTEGAGGVWTVTDIRNSPTDGVDTILTAFTIGEQSAGYGVEYLQFDDGTVQLAPEGQSPGYAVRPGKPSLNPALGEMPDELTDEMPDHDIFGEIDPGKGEVLVYDQLIG